MHRVPFGAVTTVRVEPPDPLPSSGCTLQAVLAGRLLNRGAADEVRYFGTWLQLFGTLLVAQGVRDLRREFNQPTVFAAMRARIGAI